MFLRQLSFGREGRQSGRQILYSRPTKGQCWVRKVASRLFQEICNSESRTLSFFLRHCLTVEQKTRNRQFWYFIDSWWEVNLLVWGLCAWFLMNGGMPIRSVNLSPVLLSDFQKVFLVFLKRVQVHLPCIAPTPNSTNRRPQTTRKAAKCYRASNWIGFLFHLWAFRFSSGLKFYFYR